MDRRLDGRNSGVTCVSLVCTSVLLYPTHDNCQCALAVVLYAGWEVTDFFLLHCTLAVHLLESVPIRKLQL